MVSKVTIKVVRKYVVHYLNDFHFGVGVSCGVEAIFHNANKVLRNRHEDGSWAMLTVDFLNYFNKVDQSSLLHEVRVICPSISSGVDFIYGQEVMLYFGNGHIILATRAQ